MISSRRAEYAPLRFAACAALLVSLAACGEADPVGFPELPGTGGSAGASGASGATSGSGGSAGGAANGGGAGSSAGSGGASGSAAGTSGAAGAPASVEYYVAESGDDDNPGTQSAPFASLARAHAFARPGVTIWVMPGTLAYPSTIEFTASGTEAEPIRVFAAEGARPVLEFASQARGSGLRGIELDGNYWHVKGLEIQNSADNGMLIGGSHNVIEDCVFHDNEDTGLQIMTSESLATDASRAADNLVLNCDSYLNVDDLTGGENADGFAAKLRIGTGNVFRGCRAWNNADDGWDLFAADDVVVIEQSWAFSNGKAPLGNNPGGDGNGFKLGGEPNGVGQGGAVHELDDVAAFENRTCGFTRNNNTELPVLSNCLVRDNPNGDYCGDDLECTPSGETSMTTEDAKIAARGADGSLPQL